MEPANWWDDVPRHPQGPHDGLPDALRASATADTYPLASLADDVEQRRLARLHDGDRARERGAQLRGILERSGMTNFTTPAAAVNGGFTGDKSPNQSGLRLASEV